MAFPALIQKILALRSDVDAAENDRAKLVNEIIRLSNRITALEVAAVEGAATVNLYSIGPEGYMLSGGAKVSPVTIVSENSELPEGAAFTMILGNTSNT